MKPLIDRLVHALYIAASHEGDIRIEEFLQAIAIRQEGGAGLPITLEITCHFRSWQKSLGRNKERGTGNEGNAAARWLKVAIEDNLLSLSDPPRAGQREGFTVGGVVTFTYDKNCRVVGERWGWERC